MKFAKELEEDLVPEWRAKYFDYKTGKKKVKAVARALKSANQTPKTPGRQLPANLLNNSFQSPIRNHVSLNNSSAQNTPHHRDSTLTSYGSAKPTLKGGRSSQPNNPSRAGDDAGDNSEDEDETSPMAIPRRASAHGAAKESDSLWGSGAVTSYGSIVPTPPANAPPMGPPSLELPDPALSPNEEQFPRHNRAWRQSRFNPNPHTTPPSSNRLNPNPGDTNTVGATQTPLISSQLLPKQRTIFKPRRTFSTPRGGASPARPSRLRRLFSAAAGDSPQLGDVPLEAYKEYDMRQAEYLVFLDKELDKVEAFYKMKEAENSDRLQLLRMQLHEMRDRRLEEVRAEQVAKEAADRARFDQERPAMGDGTGHANGGHKRSVSAALKWIEPIENAIGTRNTRIGKVTKSLQQWGSPPGPQAEHGSSAHANRPEAWRDFSRRRTQDDVPYRSAKRKLKLALQEFYRGLELLKSYVFLNRTAFRKINKKYDKAIKARPTGRYMSEKVNKAWFVQSEILEGQIVAVEDLYARYFERGNHKIAVSKLRSKSAKAGDYSGSIFRNGLLMAAGVVFGLQGLAHGADHLNDPNPSIRAGASYLLQLYAGYFLSLFLFLLFCLDCRVWSKAKINYVFIFEFDNRHNLDWHQLSELPCLFLFLLGLFMWLNFRLPNSNPMFLYWPVVLVGLTALIMFFPASILYSRSRAWWAYSNFRLLLAGFYPVEFRDFFLGDMYCSQTYAMGNIELFFCLYARDWNNPIQCNSTHSRLLGFFSTLPGIWRASQCLRRYYDTRNAFPHLVNFGKYTFTILFYMTISLYRIDQNYTMKALFITCATVNSIYCSIWDLAMDWSLCNPYAEYPFLRNVLGYKRPWVYYLAMFLNPILRFNWIFYAIFSGELQHSALLSFFVGFSEVCRRGIWTLFRVENEHCTNVGRFRASRDVPLPYEIEPPNPSPEAENADIETVPVLPHHQASPRSWRQSPQTFGGGDDATAAATSSSHLEAQHGPPSGSLRRRSTLGAMPSPIQRGIQRVGTIMGEAHTQDFERKRKPMAAEPGSPFQGAATAEDEESSDEEVEEDAGPRSLAAIEQDREDRATNDEDVRAAQDILDRHPSASR